jgi:hypothetical protein
MESKTFEFTEDCMNDLKKIIHAPLYYTEVGEDGSRTLALTDFGSNIYDILYNNFKKHTENASS